MPDINRKELAARYGWSLALLNSSPELKKLFDKAVKGTWTPEKFVAQLRSTKWFKKNGESARQAITLKTTDPGTYNERMRQRMAAVRSMAIEVGAGLSTSQLKDVASDSFMLGWDDNQIRRSLGEFVKRTKDGHMSGAAAAADQEIAAFAEQMGLKLSTSTRHTWSAQIAVGKENLDTVKAHLQDQAASRYPQFANQFKAGQTLAQIAEPYRQSMAEVLEWSPNNIGMQNRLLQRGLSSRDKDGNPQAMQIWQFEDELRKDPRWRKTDNAKEKADALARKVLQDWGFQS